MSRLIRVVLACLSVVLAASSSLAQADSTSAAGPEGMTLELQPGAGNGNHQAPAEPDVETAAEPAAPDSDMRDPFWPVGYKPETPSAAVSPGGSTNTPGVTPIVTAVIEDPPAWDEALKTLSIKGVMKGKTGGYMAAINNQVVSEGDIISSTLKGRKYSWKIKSIGDKGVSFERLNVASP